jgi:ornithine cyclodeaminase/alanine dehydrogenase-like protein (mu-crystallin family)
MFYISEQSVIDLVPQDKVTDVIAAAYAAMAAGAAANFPVVRERLGHADAIFGFKSGIDRTGPTLGVKAGGLWPGNRARGLANHQSTILLFDCDSGAPLALVRGTWLTALRTAAASAISIRHLARPDATVLGILGAGGQAEFQVRAALAQRAFSRLVIAGRSSARAEALAAALADTGLSIQIASAEDMARSSDVIITVTPSLRAVIAAAWVRPGTHLACMGADTVGKQEVDAALVARARLFVDEPVQAITLGECQHAHAAGLIDPAALIPIGAVINGTQAGRTSADEITLFDSTGVGLQDVAAAQLALTLAQAAGRAVDLED